MFVLSDFLFQKWLGYGFKYCLIWMKETNLISGVDQRLIDLVRSSQQIFYCIFHFLEVDEVEGAIVPFDIDKVNDFVEDNESVKLLSLLSQSKRASESTILIFLNYFGNVFKTDNAGTFFGK